MSDVNAPGYKGIMHDIAVSIDPTAFKAAGSYEGLEWDYEARLDFIGRDFASLKRQMVCHNIAADVVNVLVAKKMLNETGMDAIKAALSSD